MDWKQNETVDVISTPTMHEEEGAVTRRRFFCDSTKLPASIEVWELPPGSSDGSHVHEGEEALEEFYYFIAGRGVIWMDGEELSVVRGDAVMAPPGVDHCLCSTGEEPLKLIIAWSAPKTT